MAEATQGRSQAFQMRIGINLGDILIEPDGDIYGDGVNVAARLEQIADPGAICISGGVYEVVRDKLAIAFEDRGEQQVKNIARPIRVYALAGAAPRHSEPKPLSIAERPSIAVLPFINLSADPEQDFFSEGITEDIITELSRVGELFVIGSEFQLCLQGACTDRRLPLLRRRTRANLNLRCWPQLDA